MDQQESNNLQNQGGEQPVVKQDLPNSTAVLVLGIISIILFCCYGIGLILSIIALVLASKDLNRYMQDPAMYSENSYKNLKIGRITAIIGLVLSGVYLAWVIYFFMQYGGSQEEMMKQYKDLIEQYKV